MHSRMRLRHFVVTLTVLTAVLATVFVVVSPVARADHDTVPWATIGQIANPNATITNAYPNIVTDNNGHVYVFYDRSNRFGPGGNIRVSKFNASGGLVNSPQLWFDKQVNDVNDAVASSGFLSAAIDHTGNLYIAWTHAGVAPAYTDIYVSKSSDGGNSWFPAVRAGSPNDGTADVIPTIAAAPNGDVYVAWTSSKTTTNWFYNIGFSMSTNGGNTFINVRNISAQGPGGQAIIDSLAIDSRGRAYVAYIGEDANGNSSTAYHINMTWSDDGLVWSTPVQLTPTNNIAIYPNLAIDARDRIHFQWLDYRSFFSSGPTMWYARSDDRGATWTPQRSIAQGISTPNTLGTLSVHGDTVMSAWSGRTTAAGPSEQGMGYAISADGGITWYVEKFYSFRANGPLLANSTWVHIAADKDGTFFAGVETYDNTGTIGDGINLLWWNGPPSPPAITGVTVTGGTARVTWAAPPETDVSAYTLWRSTDGRTYSYVASVSAGTTTYSDAGLANGTYWYEVTAVDTLGTSSHPSAPGIAQIGPSLQDQINQLQRDLNNANANIADLQTRLTNLQNTLNNLQSTTQSNLTALKNQIKQLQDALNNAQAQQATQTTAYMGLGLEVLIVVLLAAILVMQMRKPKTPIMMAPAPPAPPRKPEDEL